MTFSADSIPSGRAAYEQYASDLGLDTAAFSACLDDHRYRPKSRRITRMRSALG